MKRQKSNPTSRKNKLHDAASLSALDSWAEQPRWVAWRFELQGKKRKKVPFVATTTRARVDDTSNWLTQRNARRLCRKHGFDGVGVLLGAYSERFSLCGVDLDTCRAPKTGELQPWAAEIVDRLKSYTEVSPTGTGVKIFFRLSNADRVTLSQKYMKASSSDRVVFKEKSDDEHPAGIEFDTAKRYYTATGQLLEGCANEVRRVPLEDLEWVLRDAGPSFLATRAAIDAPTVETTENGAAILAVARSHASASKKLRALLDGDFRFLKNDKSKSARDMALGGALKRLGFTREEFVAALRAYPHGAGAAKAGDARYFDRIWTRAHEVSAAARATIRLEPGNLSEVLNLAEAALLAGKSDVYRRGELIVQPVLAELEGSGGVTVVTHRLRAATPPSMLEELGRVAIFERRTRNDEWQRVDCPASVASALLARPTSRLRPILSIISAPVMRRDGSVLCEPGYDEATKLLYAPRGAVFPSVPDEPTRREAIAALEVLKDVVSTFPFVGQEDLSVALSGVMTAILRPTLRKAPLHAFTAPAAGTGKSLLVDVIAIIATGGPCPVQAQGTNKDEADKRIGTALISGDAIVCIDNCSVPLGGDKLCQALTQDIVSTRLLGHSRNIDSPAGSFFCATGNNLRILADLTRRTMLCALDAQEENPELRIFKRDAIEYAKRRRADCVIAALTVARAYRLAGNPSFPGKTAPLGSFRHWSETVRDAIMWCGSADPCETMKRARDSDPDREQLTALVGAWKSSVGEQSLTLKELVHHALSDKKHADELRDALLAAAGEAQAINTRRLGAHLVKMQGRVIRGQRIVKAPGRSGVSRWRLEKVT